MKFEKFVKTLASTGVIYERGIFKERWLASQSCYMMVPLGTRSVTAQGIFEMPDSINAMIESVGNTEPALLRKAIMPYPDGKIKDCVRIFANDASDIHIAISNDDWTLTIKETRSGTSWITPSATSGKKGSMTVTFTVTENMTYDDRSVTVTIPSVVGASCALSSPSSGDSTRSMYCAAT